MNPKNRATLGERVTRAAEAALERQNFVSPLDILEGIGWLDANTVQRWRRGEIACLESVAQTNLSRLSEAMKLFRVWANDKDLTPSETQYVARTGQRQTLQFSKSGDHTIERLYRTHWVSPALSEKKREKLAEKASRPPDLVVIQPLNQDWTCHRCAGTGGFLVMENEGPACLRCVGLDDLVGLPAGDALLSRRAKARSARSAVVVRFSRSRKQYERQGLLVEPDVLAAVESELETERREKAAKKTR